MEKTIKYLLMGFVIGLVVMFFVSFIFGGSKSDSVSVSDPSQNSQINEKTLINISKDNFVGISLGYLNRVEDQNNCRDRRDIQKHPEYYPNKNYSDIPITDNMSISYKLTNLGEYRNDMWCKIYDLNNLLVDEYKLGGSDPEVMSFPLVYTLNHDLTICCTVGGSKNPKSNEVCLPSIHINTVPC